MALCMKSSRSFDGAMEATRCFREHGALRGGGGPKMRDRLAS